MKEKFKFVLMAFVTIITMFSLSSCNKDDDEVTDGSEVDSEIVGTWLYTEYSEKPGGNFTEVYEYTEKLTFNSDGTWQWEYDLYDYGKTSQGSASGTFSTKNGKITLKCLKSTDSEEMEPGDVSTVTYLVSGNKLILEGETYTKL